ncbi:MAG: hypothetical protein NWF00_11805 [Candidatus Bathyarchaeota archaeon]|nr:hypothetical protein [Candidatus Bathyarchaeota archaeon]
MAFIGFMIFFILEHFAVYSRKERHAKEGGDYNYISASTSAFIIQLVFISFLNLIIGYLLRFEAEAGVLSLVFYTAALSLHFIILDDSMEQNYKQLYVRFGRYLASLMPIIGWGLSVFFPENPSEGYLLLGVLLGVILFNAIKDAVPKGGGKNASLFVSGAVLYSALLLVGAWVTAGIR